MRGAKDHLGKFFLALLYCPIQPDDDIMFELLAGDGDRAEGGILNLGFHIPCSSDWFPAGMGMKTCF